MNARDDVLLFAVKLVSLEKSLNKLTKIFGKLAVLCLIYKQSFYFLGFSFHHEVINIQNQEICDKLNAKVNIEDTISCLQLTNKTV